jgi:hypothetical protein
MTAIYRPDLITLERTTLSAAELNALIETGYAGIYAKTNGKWYGRYAGVETPLFGSLVVQDVDGNTVSGVATVTVPRRTLSDDGNNKVSLRLMPSPAVRKSAWINGEGTGWQLAGITAPTATGTAANANSTDSAFVRLTQAAAANAIGGIASATYNYWRPSHSPAMYALIKNASAVDAAYRAQVGFSSALLPAASDTINPTLSAFWRCSTLAGDTTWKFVTSGASGMDVVDSGIPMALNAAFLLGVRFEFNVPIGVISTDYGATFDEVPAVGSNNPLSTTDIGYACRIMTTTTTAKPIEISRVYFEAD